MRKLTVTSLALTGALLATPALADDTQGWGTLNVTAGLGGAWRAQNETVFRTSDAKGFYEIEENLMLGYKPNKQVTLWLGYTLDPNYSHGQLTTTEHRVRQQISVDNFAQLGPVKLSARLRLEERWRDHQIGTALRLRPQVRFALPIAGKTTLNLTNETFFDLNRTSFQGTGGLDRMRNAIYVSTPLAKRLSLEVGYLEQHGFVRNGPDTNDHVATVGLSASF